MKSNFETHYSFSIDQDGVLRVYTPGGMLIGTKPGCKDFGKRRLERVLHDIIEDYRENRLK